MLFSSFQGLSVLIISLAVYFVAIYLKRPEDEVRALTFTTFIIANIGLILTNRSNTRTIVETFKEKNPSVKWVIGGAFLFLFTVLFTPWIRRLFYFDFLHVHDLLICLAAGVLSILWFEVLKVFKRKNNLTRV